MRFVKGYQAMLAKFAATAIILAAPGAVALAQDTMPPPPGLLEQAMGPGFQSSGLTLRGYGEIGYIISAQRPESSYLGPGILFNEKSGDLALNQVSLVFGRSLTRERDQFDIGFVVQGIYGSDAQFTQANGTNMYGSRYANDYSSLDQPIVPTPPQSSNVFLPGFVQSGIGLRNFGQTDTQNQLDLLQAAVTFAVPMGQGLTITAGKFVTPWGMETVDPTTSPLYSHTYTFALSSPKTLTGITAGFRINPALVVTGGIVMGWDQSLKDNNDAPSVMGQVAYQIDPDWDIAASLITGPERRDDTSDFRTLLNLTSRFRAATDTTIGFEGVVGYEPNVGTDYRPLIYVIPPTLPPGRISNFLSYTGKDAFWMSVVGYIEQKLDEQGQYKVVLRGEYFNDRDGAHGLAAEVSSVTVGMKIVPFVGDRIGGGLSIRPEIRWDYAGDNIFDDLTHNAQISAGVDVIYAF